MSRTTRFSDGQLYKKLVNPKLPHSVWMWSSDSDIIIPIIFIKKEQLLEYINEWMENINKDITYANDGTVFNKAEWINNSVKNKLQEANIFTWEFRDQEIIKFIDMDGDDFSIYVRLINTSGSYF
jgi:hypothetical protein